MLTMQDASFADHSRYYVLEYQLFLAVVLKEDRVLIKGTDLSRKLDTTDQVDRYGGFVLPYRIQESVLNILCRLVFHDADLQYSYRLDAALIQVEYRNKATGTDPELPGTANFPQCDNNRTVRPAFQLHGRVIRGNYCPEHIPDGLGLTPPKISEEISPIVTKILMPFSEPPY